MNRNNSRFLFHFVCFVMKKTVILRAERLKKNAGKNNDDMFLRRQWSYVFFFFVSLGCYAQQSDTLKYLEQGEELKLNQETLDAIRNGTLIGPPPPERKRINPDVENDLKRIAKEKSLDEANKKDSVQRIPISDKQIQMMKDASRIYHRKTTVNDTQTLANPRIQLDFNDILCYIFRPDLRAKMKNKKRAQAYKTYND